MHKFFLFIYVFGTKGSLIMNILKFKNSIIGFTDLKTNLIIRQYSKKNIEKKSKIGKFKNQYSIQLNACNFNIHFEDILAVFSLKNFSVKENLQ